MALPLPLLGASTASFYRLDPTGTVPIEPIMDIVPGVSPLRITFDMIDSDEMIRRYRVTQHPLQDLVDITPHKKRELRRLQIQGTLTASPILPAPELVGVESRDAQIATNALAPSLAGVRLDRIRKDFLVQIADSLPPIMVVTPRESMALAWIVEMRTPWTPKDGRSTPVFITCLECRLAGPAQTAAIKDTESLEPGSTTSSSGGEQAGEQVGSTNTAAEPGLAPVVGGVATSTEIRS